MNYTKELIDNLSDYDLQCLEHDNEVDYLDDLTASDYLKNVDTWCNEELKKRNLPKLPRLNGFN